MNLRAIINLLLGRPVSFIDPTATIGHGTKVWHWATVLDHVRVGEGCNIGSHAELGSGTVIGNNTRISARVFLPPNSIVGRNVFIGPAVTATDDRWPRAGNTGYKAEPPIFEDGCSVGAGAVILPGVRLGKGCMVGAGAIVTRDVPPGATVRCEPAREHLDSLRALNREHSWYGGAHA